MMELAQDHVHWQTLVLVALTQRVRLLFTLCMCVCSTWIVQASVSWASAWRTSLGSHSWKQTQWIIKSWWSSSYSVVGNGKDSYLGGGRWAILWYSVGESFQSVFQAGKGCSFVDTVYLISSQHVSSTLW